LLHVPEELRYEEVAPPPHPKLKIREPRINRSEAGLRILGTPRTNLQAELSFDYDGRNISANDASRGSYDATRRLYLRRNPEAEREAARLLSEAGLKYRQPSYWEPEPGWELAASKLPRAVRMLVNAGWHIEAEGKVFRRP